jgi:cobalamin-dependent methionine synthase I
MLIRQTEYRLDSLVDTHQVLARLGAGDDGRVSARLRRNTEDAIALVTEQAQIDSVVHLENLEPQQPFPALASGQRIRSRRIGDALHGCSRAAVFVVTLGEPVDTLVAEAMETRPHFGVVLDTAASAAAEAMVDRLTAELQQSLPDDQTTTVPFCPGYCDWPLREQATLFEALPDEPAGVTLSEANLMAPSKSVAGMVGIGDRQTIHAHGIPCRRCNRADCDHRRAPFRRAD